MRRAVHRARAELVNAVPIIVHGLAAALPALILVDQPPAAMLIAAFLVGNLADVDTSYSHIGRMFYPLARLIESRYGHRTVTHSLLVVGLIAAIAYAYHQLSAISYLLSEPWAWWWWPAWYGMHLVVDMIIGGKSGAPLLWPASYRFFLFELEPNSPSEKVIAVVLVAGVGLAGLGFNIQPSRILHERAGTLEFAIQDYRDWEPWYHVLADVEATDQQTHSPVAGTFEIVAVQGGSLVLRDLETDRLQLAGQYDEPLYIRRIVARQGPPRQSQMVSTAQVTPTPEIVKVVVRGVADPSRQILVATGDRVGPDTVVADLALGLAPTPTPSASPLPPPTPTWAPDPAKVAEAKLDLQLARAQATAAAQDALPDPLAVEAARLRLALAERSLQQAQAAYDRVKWQPDIAGRPESIALERATNEYHLAVVEATRSARPDTAALAVAQARLAQAELAYQQAVATPTPPPTGTPTPPLPTPTPEPQQVRALVRGVVTGWRITEVRENKATVEIYIALDRGERTEQPGGELGGLAPAASAGGVALESVIDGDTLRVRIGSGVEKVRLIGVDTPEITKGRHDCYGIEASRFTAQMVAQGSLRIETDRELRDRYGRLLAYVWVGDRMLNEALARGGYARVKSYPPNLRYQSLLEAAEAEARAAGRGLWTACR